MSNKDDVEVKNDSKNGQKELGRKTRHIIFSTNAVVFTIVVLIIFVLVNLVIEQIPLNLDLTEEKIYSLTETSEKVMDELSDEVEIYALYDRVAGEADSEKADVIKILDLYDNHENVSVSYVDISKKPAFVKNTVGENNATAYSSGDYIVKSGDKTRRIAANDMYVIHEEQVYYFYMQRTVTGIQVETKVTGAIVRVTSDVPKIYWSVGFGEAAVEDSYYSVFVENIEDANYDVLSLDLKKEDIPADASAIFFVRPIDDLDGKTVDKLEYWFNNSGGKAFFFMDAKNYDGSFIGTDFSNFNKVLNRFGIKVNRDMVEEGEDYQQDNDSNSIFISNAIPAGALANVESYPVYCCNTRSLEILKTADSSSYEANALLETSIEATSISFDDDTVGRPGKKVIAASSVSYAGNTEYGSKAVVFGSSASLRTANAQNSAVLSFINMVKDCLEWMDISTVENPADSIDAKSYNSVTNSVVYVTESEQKVLAFIIVLAIPFAVFVVGFIVWIKRRHL